MTLLQSIVLGIIQGFTEFLPISSSAHLVLVPYWLGWEIPDQVEFIFDVLVQIGTLIAVVVYFWRDLVGIIQSFVLGILRRKPQADPQVKLGWFLIYATIPAVVAGIIFKDIIEQAFSSPMITAGFLVVTAALLFAAERLGKKNRALDQITWRDALSVGIFQAFSLFPGISRSGSTITGGMLRHMDRRSAARLSFLMSVPVMFGAGILAVIDLIRMPEFTTHLPTLLAGFIAASVAGYLSIRWLLGFLSRHSFYGFSFYCILVALFTFIVSMIRGG